MNLEPDLLYTGTGCNRYPHCMDLGRNGFVVFGVCNSVAVWKFPSWESPVTLYSHSEKVCSVKWVKDGGYAEVDLVSSCDNPTTGASVIVAHISSDLSPWTIEYSCHLPLTKQVSGVLCADALYTSSEGRGLWHRGMVVAACALDYNIHIWRRIQGEGQFIHTQSIPAIGGNCPFIRLEYFPDPTHTVLAISTRGGTHLYHRRLYAPFSFAASYRSEQRVLAFDTTVAETGHLLLAVASGNVIQVWTTFPSEENVSVDVEEGYVSGFKLGDLQYTSKKIAVVRCSEHGLRSLSWHPGIFSGDGSKLHQPMMLLAALSAQPPSLIGLKKSDGVWDELAHFETGDDDMGAMECRFDPNSLHVIFHCYHGRFVVCCLDDTEQHTWRHVMTRGAHIEPVVDLQWEPDGQYFLTASTDRSVCIHASKFMDEPVNRNVWDPVAWPQMHGHAMKCLAIVSRFTFASAAEEKVIRVFQAPESFTHLAAHELDVRDLVADDLGKGSSQQCNYKEARNVKRDDDESDSDIEDAPPSIDGPSHNKMKIEAMPTDERSKLGTVWPEIRKLYLHGNKISTLASSPCGKYLASANEATCIEDSAVAIWNCMTWKREQSLKYHKLTVTCMAFSPDSKYLLTASRNRHWCVFRQTGARQGIIYDFFVDNSQLAGLFPHLRALTACCWSYNSLHFATASRDGSLAIWHSRFPCRNPASVRRWTGQPVSALAMPFQPLGYKHVLAVGFEDGDIHILSWSSFTRAWTELVEIKKITGHHRFVRQLAFRPTDPTCLASCGDDNLVRVYDLASIYEAYKLIKPKSISSKFSFSKCLLN